MKKQKTSKLAEEKPAKFGELSALKGGDNPEQSPSDSEVECVETRRRVCLKCKSEIPKKSQKRKYCSDKCRSAYISYRHKLRHGLIKKPGVGSGGNQVGQNNHQYKTGWTTYRRKAKENLTQICNRCGSKDNLLVHHRDHDRTNHELKNLEVLCKACHQEHRYVRDKSGKFISQKT